MPDAHTPPKDTICLTQAEFDALLEYSLSLPTATTIGKRWKANKNFYKKRGPDPDWYMGEYVESPEPNHVGIVWHRILIAPEKPAPVPKPTHRCKVCGALWKLWEPGEAKAGDAGSWSLVSARCGKCCDNVAMGEQIEAIDVSSLPREKEQLSFGTLRAANVKRCEHVFHPLDSWSPQDWACAMAGETGEACNLVKKMRRGEAVDVAEIGDEIADVVIYADLLAARLGIDLGEAVRVKFNHVSTKRGSEVRL